LHEAEIIKPQFTINPTAHSATKNLITITDGACGYNQPLLHNLNFQMNATDRIAILGTNGSGKSTFIKAILGEQHLTKAGEWITPRPDAIGYLDQHYTMLNQYQSPFDAIQKAAPQLTTAEIRKHLNDFLFRKNEEVLMPIAHLSGGERVRLCLALIAAKNPALLILDEVTNNIDIQTRQHIITVLNAYPGALLVISHDQDFLKQIDREIVMSGIKAFDNSMMFS